MKPIRKKRSTVSKKVHKFLLLLCVTMLLIPSNLSDFGNVYAKTSNEPDTEVTVENQKEKISVYEESQKKVDQRNELMYEAKEAAGVTNFRIIEENFLNGEGKFDINEKGGKIYTLSMTFSGFLEDSGTDKNKKIEIALNNHFQFVTYPKAGDYDSLEEVNYDSSTEKLTYTLKDDLTSSGNFTLDFTIRTKTNTNFRYDEANMDYTLDAKYFRKLSTEQDYPAEAYSEKSLKFQYAEYTEEMLGVKLKELKEYNIIGFHAKDYTEPVKTTLYPQNLKMSDTISDSSSSKSIPFLSKIRIWVKEPQLVIPLPEGVEFNCESTSCSVGKGGGIGKMEGNDLVITFKDNYQEDLFSESIKSREIVGYFKFTDPTPGKVYTSNNPAIFRTKILGKLYEQPLSESVNFRIPKKVDIFEVRTDGYYSYFGDSGGKSNAESLLYYGFENRYYNLNGSMINDINPIQEFTVAYEKKYEQLSPSHIGIGVQYDSSNPINWFDEYVASVAIEVTYTDGTSKTYDQDDFEIIMTGGYGVNIRPEGKVVQSFKAVFKDLNFTSLKAPDQEIIKTYLRVFGDVNYVDNDNKPLSKKLTLPDKEYSITPKSHQELDYNYNEFTEVNGKYIERGTGRVLNTYVDNLRMDASYNNKQTSLHVRSVNGKYGVKTLGATNGEVSFYLFNTDTSVVYKNLKVHPKIGSKKEEDSNLLMPLYDDFFFESSDNVDYGEVVFKLNNGDVIPISIDEGSTKYKYNSSVTYNKIHLDLEENVYVVDYYFTIKELRRPSNGAFSDYVYFMCRASEEMKSNVLKDKTELDITVDKKDYANNYLTVNVDITSDNLEEEKKYSGTSDNDVVAYAELVNFGKPEIIELSIRDAIQATGNSSVPMALQIKTGDYVFRPNIILKVDPKFKINEDSLRVYDGNSIDQIVPKSNIKSYYKDGYQYISIGLESKTVIGHDRGYLEMYFDVFVSPELPGGKVPEDHAIISDVYLSGDETIREDYIVIDEGYHDDLKKAQKQAYTFQYDTDSAVIDVDDVDNDGDTEDYIMHSNSNKTIPIYPIKEFGIFSTGSSSLVNNASEVTAHAKDEVSVRHIFNGNSESNVSNFVGYIPIPKKNRESLIVDEKEEKPVTDEFDSYLMKEVTISNPDLNRDNVEILYTTSKNPTMNELYENPKSPDTNYVSYDKVEKRLDEVTMIKVTIKKLGKDNTQGISKVVVETELKLPEKEDVGTFTSYQNIRYRATLEGESTTRVNQFANTIRIKLIDYTLSGSLWYDRNYDNNMGDGVERANLANIHVALKKGNEDQTPVTVTQPTFNSSTKNYDYSILTPNIETGTKVVLRNIPKALQLIYPGDNPKQNSSFDRNTQEVAVEEDISKAGVDNLNAGFSDVRTIEAGTITLQQGNSVDVTSKTSFTPDYLGNELGVVAEYKIKSNDGVISLNGTQIKANKVGEATLIAKIENGLYKSDGTVDGYIEKEFKVEVYASRISVSIPKEMKFQVVTNTNTGKPEFVSSSYAIENLASPVDFELSNIIDKDRDSKLRLTHSASNGNNVYEMALGMQSTIQQTVNNIDISIDDMELKDFKAVSLGHLNGQGSEGNQADLMFTSDKFEQTDFPQKPSDHYTRNIELVFKFTLSKKE